MKEIYQIIKKEYPNKKARYDKYLDVIYINWDDYEISADNDIVDLLYKGLPYDHMHPKNNEEIYTIIKYFINNADKIINKTNRKNKINKILLIILIIFLIISQIYLKYFDK